MRLKSLLSFPTIILVILLANPFATNAALVPVSFSVGDTFTFEYAQYSVTEKTNGTDYSDTLPYSPGTSVDVTVDDIKDEPAFLAQTDTNVSYTETDGTNTYEGASYVDDWSTLSLIGFLLVALGTYGYPNDWSFDTPDAPSDLDDEPDTFPYFVSLNTTFYQEFASENSIAELVTPEFTYKHHSSFDMSTKEFSFDLLYSATNTTTTDEGEAASLDLYFKFEIEADLDNGVISHLLFQYELNVVIGDGSEDIGLVIEVNSPDWVPPQTNGDQPGGNTTTGDSLLNFPIVGATALISLSIFAIANTYRSRKD